MKKKIITSITMVVLMVLCIFPAVSLAEDTNVTLHNGGSYDLTELTSGGTVTVDAGASVTITGDNILSMQDVQINCGEGATVTINSIAIINQHKAPVKFTGSGNTLILKDGSDNTLQTETEPAVWVTSGADLTIKGSGKLDGWGGDCSAFIGTNYNESAAAINIEGGNISGNGGNNGAGIGGGQYGSATVNISGGTINVIAGGEAAAIGGGKYGTGTAVNISGGTVTALGQNASGIGTGYDYSGTGGAVSISGGTVFAEYWTDEDHTAKDIDSGSLSISGSAAVFLRHDSCTTPTITNSTHSHYSYSAGTTEVYGVKIPSVWPSDWTDAFGAYLRVCTLTYDANGGTGAPSALTQLYGTTASLASGTGLSYREMGLKGWNTKDDGSGTLYSPGDTYTFKGTETLYAQWDGPYIKAVSGNDSYGFVSGRGYYKQGTDVTVTATPNTGYYFAGWYKDGALVSASASYKFTAGDDITLTAQFDVVGIPETITSEVSAYNKIALTWSAAGGAAGYRIWRSTSENGTFTAVKTTVATTYTDTGLKICTTYYYKVQAYTSAKVYGKYYSMTASAMTEFGQVAGVKVTSSDPRSAKITWNALYGATKYEVWRATSDGIYTLAGTTSARTFTNTGLTTDVTYSYKVIAYRTVSGEAIYGDFSSAVTVTPKVAQVTGVKAVRSGAKVKISWSAVSGAAKYEVWVSDTEGGTYTLLGETASRYYYDTTASTRYYEVRAYNLIIKTKHYGDYSSPAAML